MIENNSKYTEMEYNSAVEDFQDIEYPMLQGKLIQSHTFSRLTIMINRKDILGPWRYHNLRKILDRHLLR
jgi:hypothetical protein